jgi:hypothetical protein
VSSVREQRETARDETAHDLGHHERTGQGEDDRERAPVSPPPVVVGFVPVVSVMRVGHGLLFPVLSKGQPDAKADLD